MKATEFKHKRNYNEMLNQNNSLSNSLSNNIHTLPVPKFKYYNFLNDKFIGKEENKSLLAINNGELFKNIENNAINIYYKNNKFKSIYT